MLLLLYGYIAFVTGVVMISFNNNNNNSNNNNNNTLYLEYIYIFIYNIFVIYLYNIFIIIDIFVYSKAHRLRYAPCVASLAFSIQS